MQGIGLQGIDLHCSVGTMHVFHMLPAPANWYARFGYEEDTLQEAIAAFALIYGPDERRTRLVGLLGNEKELIPVDCYEDYRDTVYIP